MTTRLHLSGARFSPCRTWRYVLWRQWSLSSPKIAFIGLNPSTADETNDDPTVRRCIGFARRWGFGGMYMLNVFAYRSTNPKELKTADDPVGPRNDASLAKICRRCEMVVACWGVWGRLFDRSQAVIKLLNGIPIHCLGRSSATGNQSRPDFPHDVVDLKRLEEGRRLFELRTPGGQESLPGGFLRLPIGFISNLFNRRFPILQVHRLFLVMTARFTKVLQLLSAYREAEVALESLSALVMETCSAMDLVYTHRPSDMGNCGTNRRDNRRTHETICYNGLNEISWRPAEKK
jgi:hypothetical protein